MSRKMSVKKSVKSYGNYLDISPLIWLNRSIMDYLTDLRDITTLLAYLINICYLKMLAKPYR